MIIDSTAQADVLYMLSLEFCYVITGDLRVIDNAKLRELVAKGPKYREPNRVNWKATETMFLESIDLYAKNWSKREQVELN